MRQADFISIGNTDSGLRDACVSRVDHVRSLHQGHFLELQTRSLSKVLFIRKSLLFLLSNHLHPMLKLAGLLSRPCQIPCRGERVTVSGWESV